MMKPPSSHEQSPSGGVKRTIIGLLAGPLLLIVLGFIFFGAWGLIIGMFIGMAAVFFVPAFAGLMRVAGARSLPAAILVANSIPAAWWAYSCPLSGNACPNYSAAAAAPQYIAATICAIIYWALALRRR